VTSAPFAASADCYQARIVESDGTILGTGLLISYNQVLTCAHVLSEETGPPTEDFVIEFPRSRRQVPVLGRVAAEGWLPVQGGDLAILEFDGRLDDNLIRPARLGLANGARGRAALAYGHPDDAPDGLWARVDVLDSTGGERIQLVPRPGLEVDRIARGFSGGPVLDEVTASVIGIVVSTLREPQWVAGWMIPMEVVARHLRQVQDVMPGAFAGDQDIDPAELDRVAETLSRVPHLAGPTGRQRIAERLPGTSRARLPHPPPATIDLVRACSRPSELRILIDLVRYFDSESFWDNRLERQLEMLGAADGDADSEETGALADASMLDLRRALVQVPYFRDAHTRHLYLDAFERRMAAERNKEVRLDRTDDAGTDAEILLRECRRIPGALRELTKDFPAGDRDLREFRNVEAMINHLTRGQLLLDRECSEFLALIDGWPVQLIRAAARKAQPWPPGDEAVPADPLSVIRWVEGRSQRRDGLPRIIEFAEELTVRTSNKSAAVALSAWSDRLAARLRLEYAAVEALRRHLAEAAAAEASGPILTIQLAPDALQPQEQFLLQAVLEHHGELHPVASADEPLSLRAVRACVDQVLDDTYQALGDDEEALRVEVIVPRILLTEPFDQWRIQEAISVPIGEKLPLVLRSFERMRNRRIRQQWANKWRLAQEQEHPDPGAMHYVGPDDGPTPHEVFEALSPDRKLALALGRAPARQPNDGPSDAVSGAMQAGVAYVVWVRDVSLADDFRAAIQRVLADIPVRDLPARIAQWRAPGTAGVDPGTVSLAKHISLLACDHDRREPIAGRILGSPPRRSS
jgi:hypothetical protein